MDRRSKRNARQLALAEQDQQTPRWETLPEKVRGEAVALLAKLLQSETVADEEEEVGDE